jgi:hypothetical protein
MNPLRIGVRLDFLSLPPQTAGQKRLLDCGVGAMQVAACNRARCGPQQAGVAGRAQFRGA